MKERLITLLSALAALALVIFLFTPPDTQKPVSLPTTEDRGTDGLKGLFVWLQREHVAVVSFRKRYTELGQGRGNLLVTSLPAPSAISKAEWSALNRWLKQGNTLLVLAAVYHRPTWSGAENCFCDLKDFLDGYAWLLDKENSEKKSDNRQQAEKAKSFRESVAAMQAAVKSHVAQASRLQALSSQPLLQGVKELDTQTMPYLLEQHWTLSSTDKDNLALRLFNVDDDPTATAGWQISADAGRIVLLLAPDVFSNSRLSKLDNARFISNLLRLTLAPHGRVLFDDYHFGLAELYDPEHFFKDVRLHKTLGFLGVLWLLYVLGHSNRLAPVRMRVSQPSALDFIEVMSGFFAHRLNNRLLAEALVQHLLADICRQHRLQNEAEAWRWLEQHGQITGAQLGQLKQSKNKQRRSLQQLTNTITYIRTLTL